MRKKAKIFSPDMIKTQISQAVFRDLERPIQEYGLPSNPTFLTDNHKWEKSQKWKEAKTLFNDRLVSDLCKKYIPYKDNDESRRLHALLKFMEINIHMDDINRQGIDLPDVSLRRPQSTYSARDNILLRARAMMRHVLSPFDEDEWFRCCKHGTGSSIGVSYSDTSVEAKSTFPISMTSRVVPLFSSYLNFDSLMKRSLVEFNQGNPISDWYQIVEGSRATTVPKNTTIDRMIAVEPTGNMFFQQGLMEMMYSRMKRCGLDVESLPTRHRHRARFASILSNEGTIDWSSASDTVSTELLRWLMPPVWFECCDMVRSTAINIDGDMVELSMFSTMGNAVTFPLETLVFWTLAHACKLEVDGSLSHFPEWEDRHRCSVFGDDCIVPTYITDIFIEMMESVGFICNVEKTFIDEGGFRESCGGDFLHGYDVRPFSLKGPQNRRLSSLEPWLYIIANRLLEKYISYFGNLTYIYDKELFRVLVRLFREYKLQIKLVPPYYPDDSGLKISDDLLRFVSCYRPVLSRVAVNEHGTYTFLYLRFNYRKQRARADEIHYAFAMKAYRSRERSHKWNDRRIGGYVVARGRSSYWTVPSTI